MTFAFDWTVNISTIFSLLVFVGGAIGIYLSWKSHSTVTDMQLENLADAVKGLREDMRPIPSAITTLAVQEDRFKSMERRIALLEGKLYPDAAIPA